MIREDLKSHELPWAFLLRDRKSPIFSNKHSLIVEWIA